MDSFSCLHQDTKREKASRIAAIANIHPGSPDALVGEITLDEPSIKPDVERKQTVNVVADLEEILKERDACGVSGCNPAIANIIPPHS